ncbi:hypothetical protein ACIQWR_38505 [Streptomyces sp. NPDC098789]|uniref:hypothetical protein n=1 Tax=Streptomyces sp. NPDC098789 TaxID=3366098 RepID=UPI0037FF4D0E
MTAKGSRMSVSRPGDGCLAEAETRLLGDGRMRWLQVRIMLFEGQEQARQDVEKNAAFRAATTRWRQCMEQAGFPQQDPVKLLGTLRTDEARRTSPACCTHPRGPGAAGSAHRGGGHSRGTDARRSTVWG